MAEGESVEVTVTLSADPERDVTVEISATGQGGVTEQDNTDADYFGVPGSVMFTDGGELSQTFTITAVNDTVDDDGESILLGFGNVPPGVTRGTGVTVTIEDDDVPDVVVSFEKAAYDVDEGASVRVTVKLDKDPERQVVIPITTSDQGATPVLDYSGVPTSVTFESGETEQVISFGATQDTLNDDGESVVIGFGSSLPSQVTVTGGMTSSTTVTIVDDDNPNVTVNFERDVVRRRRGRRRGGGGHAQRRPRALRHDPDHRDRPGWRHQQRLRDQPALPDVRERRRDEQVARLLGDG